jgi:hypothetical protein
MSSLMLDAFREVVVDTEFTTIAGERPEPVCLVAHELRSGRRFRIFEGQFGSVPQYATGPTYFSWRSTRALSWASTACSAGRGRNACSIFSSNFGTTPTASRRQPVRTYSARWRTSAPWAS